MMNFVPLIPAKLQKLWNDLQLRVLVLLSLFLQIVLIATGNRRKYTKRKWVAAILWLSYLSADSVATLALGVLTQAEGNKKHVVDPSYTIMAFWAPFLLMHLGGPDTITAYALADNELWARHLLGLIGQVIVAIYVFCRSYTRAYINYIWIVVFVAGFVKYGERSWVLFSASKDQFRESMVTVPDPGPNYAKFMDELVLKEQEGYEVSLKDVIDTVASSAQNDLAENVAGDETDRETVVLQEAYSFFGTFKKLFADLILSFQDKELSFSVFTDVDMTWGKAFSIVEVELGLVYDLFYTKACVLYSWIGLVLRTLTCLSTISAFIAFLIVDKNVYPKTEVIITYILLVGAIFLEIYALVILLSSDRTMIWLTGDWTTIGASRKFKDLIVLCVRGFVFGLRKLHIVPAKMRWCNEMGQYNVLNHCIKGKRRCKRVRQYLEKYLFWESTSIPQGLKKLIFDELKERANSRDEKKKKGSYRGDKKLFEEINSSPQPKDGKQHIIEAEFDQSLLLWHMATDFCYYTDVKQHDEPKEGWLHKFNADEEPSPEDSLKFKREICKLLSNYMMHLLIMSPFMLPSGIGQIRFQDTCAEATEFFDKQKLEMRDACKRLDQVDTRLAPSQVKGDRSKSLLFDACNLAKSLQSLKDENSQLLKDKKWEKICEAWLYLLTFAAAQCGWSDHAEKLSQGGELLTHVWLLMAHFGMADQFQISQGYVRAKLQLA